MEKKEIAGNIILILAVVFFILTVVVQDTKYGILMSQLLSNGILFSIAGYYFKHKL